MIVKVTFLNVKTKLDDHVFIEFTGLYRCHHVEKKEFINFIELFLKNNIPIQNHVILGNLYFDLNNDDELNS